MLKYHPIIFFFQTGHVLSNVTQISHFLLIFPCDVHLISTCMIAWQCQCFLSLLLKSLRYKSKLYSPEWRLLLFHQKKYLHFRVAYSLVASSYSSKKDESRMRSILFSCTYSRSFSTRKYPQTLIIFLYIYRLQKINGVSR